MRDFAKWLMVAFAVSLGISEHASAAYLGLKSSDAPAAIGGGAVVAAAAPNSPAMIAGLMPNDVVIGVDGQRIQNADQLGAAVAARKPGEVVSLDVMRFDGQNWRRIGVRVTLGGAPSDGTNPEPSPTVGAAGSTPAMSTPGAGAPIAVSGWTRVVDPNLHAFTFEVPQNWNFLAGAPPIRPKSSSFAIWSPDGSLAMIYNPVKLLNLQTFPVSGMPVYQPSEYLPAPYFIMALGAPLLSEYCQSPRLRSLRLRNDIAERIDAAYPGSGQRVAADAMFSCERNGKPSLAYMAVGTHLIAVGPSLGTWQVDFEEFVIAPGDQIAAAIAIMIRSLRSVEWSPVYLQAAGLIVSAGSQAAMRGLDESLHESHQVDNIINGVGDFFNPANPRATIQAPAGFERYCQDGLGIVYGSNGGTIKPNCQQLTPVQ